MENKIRQKMHNIDYKSFTSLLALMFGFTIFSASVMSGGELADNMKTWQGAVAIVIGNFLLAIYGGILAYISKKSKNNLDGVLKRAFGTKGAIVPSMVMVISQIGWIGVGFAMIAMPLARLTKVSPYVFVVPVALLIITTAFFGIKSLTILSFIAVPLVIILGIIIISIVSAKSIISESTNIKWSIWAGISLAIGTFISGATFVPNFSVNAKNTKDAWITTVLAFFVGNGLMISFGFIAGLLSNDKIFDFVTIAKKGSLVGIGLVILIMNIWTTNDSALYSISLGLKNWFKVPKKVGVVILGLIAAGASIWLLNNFVFFLSMLNSFIPAIGAIIMSTFFFRKEECKFYWYKTNWVAILIWAFASSITFIPTLQPYIPIVAFLIAFSLSVGWIFLEQQIWVKNKYKENVKNEI